MIRLFLIALFLLLGCSIEKETTYAPVSEEFLLSNKKGLGLGSKEAFEEQKKQIQDSMPLEIKLKKSGIVFRLIPKGKFKMGSQPDEAGKLVDQKIEVINKPFYIGKFEVSQKQWTAVMGKNSSVFKGENNPVENINWHECQLFLKKLGDLEGADYKFSLPTEIEWEYACRAGSIETFTYGLSLSSKQANFIGTEPYDAEQGPDLKRTCSVGQYQDNAWGLFDVHGNVAEFCQNTYLFGEERVAVTKGGSWQDTGAACKSSTSSFQILKDKSNRVGFRIKLTRR